MHRYQEGEIGTEEETDKANKVAEIEKVDNNPNEKIDWLPADFCILHFIIIALEVLMDFRIKLDKNTYKAGETAKGTLLIRSDNILKVRELKFFSLWERKVRRRY